MDWERPRRDVKRRTDGRGLWTMGWKGVALKTEAGWRYARSAGALQQRLTLQIKDVQSDS